MLELEKRESGVLESFNVENDSTGADKLSEHLKDLRREFDKNVFVAENENARARVKREKIAKVIGYAKELRTVLHSIEYNIHSNDIEPSDYTIDRLSGMLDVLCDIQKGVDYEVKEKRGF